MRFHKEFTMVRIHEMKEGTCCPQSHVSSSTSKIVSLPTINKHILASIYEVLMGNKYICAWIRSYVKVMAGWLYNNRYWALMCPLEHRCKWIQHTSMQTCFVTDLWWHLRWIWNYSVQEIIQTLLSIYNCVAEKNHFNSIFRINRLVHTSIDQAL